MVRNTECDVTGDANAAQPPLRETRSWAELSLLRLVLRIGHRNRVTVRVGWVGPVRTEVLLNFLEFIETWEYPLTAVYG